MKVIGIYAITNLLNYKVYVGASKNIKTRFSQHRISLKNNVHDNIHLQSAWNKYGITNFQFDIIEECKTEELLNREQFYLNIAKQYPQHYYNMGFDASCAARGIKRSMETKLKMCYPKSENHKRKISEARKGIIPWNKGKTNVYSKESLKKMSESNLGITRNLGVKFSKEHRKNLSKATKNHWRLRKESTKENQPSFFE